MAFPLVGALWAGFVAILPQLVVRVVAALGIGVLTYTGIKELVDMALSMVQSNINSLGADILQFVAVFNVDRYVMIIFSAFTVRLVFQGLQATGIVSRLQFKGIPGGGA